jgi:hypothetical protein
MSTRITESYLRLVIKKELANLIKEGDVVDYNVFKQMQTDREEERVGQEKAGERVEQIRKEILHTFAAALNKLKTRIYDKEDPQYFDDAANSIGPNDLYTMFRDYVLENEDDIDL